MLVKRIKLTLNLLIFRTYCTYVNATTIFFQWILSCQNDVNKNPALVGPNLNNLDKASCVGDNTAHGSSTVVLVYSNFSDKNNGVAVGPGNGETRPLCLFAVLLRRGT